MKMPHRKRSVPLQLVLILPFALQIFGAVGLVGYLSFKNGQKAVGDLADRLMDRTSDVVDEHLKSYLSIPQTLNQINADAVRRGLLNVQDRETIGKYFWDQMQAYDLTYIGMGLTTGEGLGAARYDGKTITIDDWTAKPPNNLSTYATDNQGNRTQVKLLWDWNNLSESWYTEPIAAGKPIWKIYTANFPTGPYITASASRPIYDSQSRLLGMIGSDIHLLKLSDFLRDLDVGRSGKIFILERDGMLIANSSQQQPFTLADNAIQRLKAVDSPDLTVQAITQQLQSQFDGLQSISEDQKLQLEIQDESHYVQVLPWRDTYGLDWLVVVAVPESEFMSQINANTRTTVLLCLGALIVASVLGLVTSRWIMHPILRLNQSSEAMASGNLNQTVGDSSIRELDALSSSFNHMAVQLRESFTALEKNREELEDRVEDRTAELKATLGELQRTQAQVIQSEKMSSLGQLVAGVAHEINNPVNFIHGNLAHVQDYTQSILDLVHLYQQHYPDPVAEIETEAEEIDLEFLQEDLPKMLTSMKVGTERIRQIVLSLRNFSRMDESEIKPVDIHAGLDSTLMILQHRLKARPERPEIEVVKEYEDLPLVECYAGQLNQVFMNILVNAIDALEENDARKSYQEIQTHPNQIKIRTTVVNEWVQISVADNGPGIPEEVQKRIFDPFYTTKPVGKGTGMGMSISYQIVTEKHNGKLDCFSSRGQGTEFVIQIPIQITPETV